MKKKNSHNELEEFVKDILSLVKKRLVEEEISSTKKIESFIRTNFENIEKHVYKEGILSFKKIEKMHSKYFKESMKKIDSFVKKIEDLEETFMIMYHNIKRNQFIYSNYPEEWWDNHYIHFRENLLMQNKEVIIREKE